MLNENAVKTEERYLVLEGLASSKTKKALESVLPKSRLNSRVCFVSFAYADIPVGKEFEVVFPKQSPSVGLIIPSRIMAVTQQFAKSFDIIPHGWKTICLIEFPLGIPAVIENLPIVDQWYQSSQMVCLASRETWLALLEKATNLDK